MTSPIPPRGPSDRALFQSDKFSQLMEALKSPGANSASIHQQNEHAVFYALFPQAMNTSSGGPTPLTAFNNLDIEAKVSFMQKVAALIPPSQKSQYEVYVNSLTQQAARQKLPGANGC